jgi:hypothetical protein
MAAGLSNNCACRVAYISFGELRCHIVSFYLSVDYLMTLFIAEILPRRLAVCLMNNELVRMWKEAGL